MAESQEQHRVLKDFTTVRIRPIGGNVEGAKVKMLAFAKARCTSLTIGDIWNEAQIPDWQGQIYRCLAHKDDVDAIVRLFKTW